MERVNAQGIPRENLKIALRRRRTVMKARQVKRCLLCCDPRVNEAALCDTCWATLDEEELRLGERWLAGVGP